MSDWGRVMFSPRSREEVIWRSRREQEADRVELCVSRNTVYMHEINEKLKVGRPEANDKPFYSYGINYNHECPWKLYITVNLKGDEGVLPLPGR